MLTSEIDYLSICYSEGVENQNCTSEYLHLLQLPFANSPLFRVSLADAVLLTCGDDVKKVFKLSLCIKNISYKDFLPGDTIGVIPQNDDIEVNEIIERLELETSADLQFSLTVLETTKKKSPKIPPHIPKSGTIREAFKNNLDVRSPPKKVFLRTLLRYASSKEDIDKLSKIVSPEGSDEYLKLINGEARTLLGLLRSFPSCRVPVERLFEHLPSLKPRPYSISSSPINKNYLDITFSVVSLENNVKGVCSGWLENIIEKRPKNSDLKISFYFRKPSQFRLPEDASKPLVMIGPGTGIAPFVGFLQHRYLRKIRSGKTWLFYGCRYKDRDFLFKTELDLFLGQGVLSRLFSCFSREGTEKRYVQDEINDNESEFVELVLKENAYVFVCGDAKGMVKDVKTMIISSFDKYRGLDAVSGEEYLSQMQKEGRYVEDVWI